MYVDFYKYQGAGNDFIILDDRKSIFDEFDHAKIAKLCDRRFGIGADGLMLLRSHPDFDFEMLYFNADGHLGSMCGNGGRCIVAFAHFLGLFDTDTVFLAVDGPHQAIYDSDKKLVKLGMSPVDRIDEWHDSSESDFDKSTSFNTGFYLNTGSPHLVISLDEKELKTLDIALEGARLRHHHDFKNIGGINVNFVASKEDSIGYNVRTFERGVEDETFACGTGATAAAIVKAFQDNLKGSTKTSISVRGGELVIHFSQMNDKFTEIFLEGPAIQVFKGQIELDSSSTNS